MIVKQGCKLALMMAGFAAVATPAMAKEYIVKLKDAAQVRSVAEQKTFSGLTIRKTHAPGALVAVEIADSVKSAEAANQLAALMTRDDVEYVVESFKLQAFAEPNDPKYAEQWHLPKVGAPAAWDVLRGSRDVKVAVIDTGVDYNHADLAANIWTNPGEIAGNGVDDDGNGKVDDVHGYDFLDNDADPNDATSAQNPGHGTHCAGIIGSVGDNGMGTSGIAQQVSIMPLRFIGPTGQGDLMAAIEAIDYAIANHAAIISASWGAKVPAGQAQPLIDAVGRANTAGVIFVAAAANDGANNDSTSMYPANSPFPNVIAVAASDPSDAKPSWSNYGKAKVALASPGQDIISTLPNGQYNKLSGTSMATPLVAGMVALLRSHPEGTTLTGPEARSLLQSTGARVAIETACMCRVDAAAAVNALQTNKLVVVPAAGTFAVNDTVQMSAIGGAGGYTFASANPAVVEVTAQGMLTAKANGETTVKVTDSAGASVDSLTIRVADAPSDGGGGDMECPLGDPQICQALCAIIPTAPWCSK